MGLVNLWIVGGLGYREIAAVGISNVIVQNLSILLVSLGYEVTIVVARTVGKYKNNNIEKICINGIIGSIIFNGAACLLFVVFSENIMALMADQEVIKIGLAYFQLRLISIVLISVSRVLLGALRGIEKTKSAMFDSIIANIANIAISYLLVIILQIGLIGAAVSVIISEILFIVLLSLNLKRNNINILNKIKEKIDITQIKIIYINGIKIGLQDIGLSLSTIFFTYFAAKIGTIELASTEIVLNILSLAYLPGIAIGVTAATEVSKNVGFVESHHGVYLNKLLKKLFISTAVLVIPICLIGVIFANPISAIFSQEKTVQLLVVKILFLASFFLLFDAFQMVLMDALRGFQINNLLIFISIFLSTAVFTPICYFISFVLNYGIMGMWASFYIYILIQFTVLLILYIRETNKLERKIQNDQLFYTTQ